MHWLLLVYKIPREPTASRVYVWRKLKQLGAIAVQDAIWVLPASPRTQEQFQWLAAEIVELQGEASLFQSQVVFASDGPSLQEQFEAPTRAAYEKILVALKRRKPDLVALSKQFQLARNQDFFRCELGERVRKELLKAGRRRQMKWVTWETVGIDRMACAWLIRKQIDTKAKFLFVPKGMQPLPTGAEPFDIPGVRLSHRQGHCSFHTLLDEYKLDDPVLHRIARIVDEADTVQAVHVETAAPGLDLICDGIRLTSPDDLTALERGAMIYDALYAKLAAE